jgi:hypothetical protein
VSELALDQGANRGAPRSTGPRPSDRDNIAAPDTNRPHDGGTDDEDHEKDGDGAAEDEDKKETDKQTDNKPEPKAKTLFEWALPAARVDAAEDEPDEVGPMATDRPDFTESSATVGRGVWQVESGYTYFFDREDDSQNFGHSYPEILSRYGLWADWLELRLGWNFGSEEENDFQSDGAEDLYLGVKFALTEQAHFLPEMALVPQLTVPSGDDAFTADAVLAGVNWLYGWDVTERLTTAGSTQINRAFESETDDRYTELAQSWTVGVGITEQVGAYTEWFAFIPSGATIAGVEHYLNGGFTLNLFDVQWDIRAGVGLNDHAIDYFAGMGLSVRLRPKRTACGPRVAVW